MPIQINSPGWRVRRGASRGLAPIEDPLLPGLPGKFVPPGGEVAEEAVVEAPQATRGGEAPSGTLDMSADLKPNQTAVLVIRHPSGALTFHAPVQSGSRGADGAARVRFQVAVPHRATRGLATAAVK